MGQRRRGSDVRVAQKGGRKRGGRKRGGAKEEAAQVGVDAVDASP